MQARASVCLIVAAGIAWGQQWRLALPGYRYEFPRDHFNHPDYQTEWWYYTGNLRSADGHRFGFELTFFREGVRLSEQQAAESDATWRPGQVYVAHLALSDLDGHAFYHTERLNRAGPGLAGSSLKERRYWNGNWQAQWSSLASGEQQLQAVCDRFTLRLNVRPEKPLVIHGQDGVSRKGPQPGEASHYISFTRMSATGTLERWSGRSFSLDGTAWMDHEFFSQASDQALVGWDWFAIQLNTREELMLYRLRRKPGGQGPFSSGTYVDASGRAQFLSASDFTLTPGATWRSAASGASYPVEWKISVAGLGLDLMERTELRNQELFSKESVTPSYWEGAVAYDGRIRSQPVQGVGYLEMTGYAGSQK